MRIPIYTCTAGYTFDKNEPKFINVFCDTDSIFQKCTLKLQKFATFIPNFFLHIRNPRQDIQVHSFFLPISLSLTPNPWRLWKETARDQPPSLPPYWAESTVMHGCQWNLACLIWASVIDSGGVTTALQRPTTKMTKTVLPNHTVFIQLYRPAKK
jgi:hypothetical protein